MADQVESPGDSIDPSEAARALGKLGASKGGKARAKSLTPERRSEIARKAVEKRWERARAEGGPPIPSALHTGVLKIGNAELPCAVLEDGTRVLTQANFLEALGRHRKANVRKEDGEEQLPAILQGKSIKPFLDKDLIAKSTPVKFRTPNGSIASGYRAEVLPGVCEVYLKAREEGTLNRQQVHVAKQAEILIRGLANIGIIALVDEATGYQEIRAKNALAKILEAFIAKELQAYIDAFPRDFYQELFRLRGLEYPRDSVKRPQYFGYLTNDIVYKRIAPGVLDELKRITPRANTGRLKHKYYQRLTSNVGYPKLREHLGAVVAIMKLSSSWADFIDKLDRLHPRYGETMKLAFADFNPEDDTGSGL